ncbi:hypothetical protein ACO0K7_18360 [Undibacterium sp. Ji67W]|uniref:hypothetical protein n=1 Tax=Undibacterium sp. Ji67W TaxID=3413042 RepID=UPI003BF0C31B
MSNIAGNAYGLSILSPIKNGRVPGKEIAYADLVRDKLQAWNREFNSPMALVPQTYLCRFYVLDDVVTESLPGGSSPDTWSDVLPVVPDSLRRDVMPKQDRLQSRYLVFCCNFYAGPAGTPDAYLRGMWEAINGRIHDIWDNCYGFENIHHASDFIAYMKKCQVTTSLFFNGSTDQPLEEQLKALYMKQEFTKFAIENQGLSATAIRANYRAFMLRTQLNDLQTPSWQPGQYRL